MSVTTAATRARRSAPSRAGTRARAGEPRAERGGLLGRDATRRQRAVRRPAHPRIEPAFDQLIQRSTPRGDEPGADEGVEENPAHPPRPRRRAGTRPRR